MSEAKHTPGADLITAERLRQISAEGWTLEHDSEHKYGELALAAICYVRKSIRAGFSPRQRVGSFDLGWPWERSWWKPSPNRIRNLVKAGALIAAEIDRIQSESK